MPLYSKGFFFYRILLHILHHRAGKRVGGRKMIYLYSRKMIKGKGASEIEGAVSEGAHLASAMWK